MDVVLHLYCSNNCQGALYKDWAFVTLNALHTWSEACKNLKWNTPEDKTDVRRKMEIKKKGNSFKAEQPHEIYSEVLK